MKQQLNKLLITSSLLLALSACGGSSSSDSNDVPINETTTPSTVNYHVIDGYLSTADVCVIRQGETNCESIGSTDENGLISVDSDLTAGKIVATVIAGQTKDSDNIGFVARTYQMVAEISEVRSSW